MHVSAIRPVEILPASIPRGGLALPGPGGTTIRRFPYPGLVAGHVPLHVDGTDDLRLVTPDEDRTGVVRLLRPGRPTVHALVDEPGPAPWRRLVGRQIERSRIGRIKGHVPYIAEGFGQTAPVDPAVHAAVEGI